MPRRPRPDSRARSPQQKMHRAGDASVRLSNRPPPKRLPLGEPSTSGAPYSVQSRLYGRVGPGSSTPVTNSAQIAGKGRGRCPPLQQIARAGPSTGGKHARADADAAIRTAAVLGPSAMTGGRVRSHDVRRAPTNHAVREEVGSERCVALVRDRRRRKGVPGHEEMHRAGEPPSDSPTDRRRSDCRSESHQPRASVLGASPTLWPPGTCVKSIGAEELANCDLFFSHGSHCRSWHLL